MPTEKTRDAVLNNLATQYLASLYWAFATLTTVGYGDILPQNNVEYTYVILMEFVGIVVFGMVISSVTQIVANFNQKAKFEKQRIQMVTTYGRERRLPKELQRRVRQHFDYHLERTSAFDIRTILNEVSTSLRNDICLDVFGGLISDLPFLHGRDASFLASACIHLLPFYVVSGDYVGKRGVIAMEIYWVRKGYVKLTPDPPRRSKMVAEGRMIGAEALMMNYRMVYDMRAVEDCHMLYMNRDELLGLCFEYPALKQELLLSDSASVHQSALKATKRVASPHLRRGGSQPDLGRALSLGNVAQLRPPARAPPRSLCRRLLGRLAGSSGSRYSGSRVSPGGTPWEDVSDSAPPSSRASPTRSSVGLPSPPAVGRGPANARQAKDDTLASSRKGPWEGAPCWKAAARHPASIPHVCSTGSPSMARLLSPPTSPPDDGLRDCELGCGGELAGAARTAASDPPAAIVGALPVPATKPSECNVERCQAVLVAKTIHSGRELGEAGKTSNDENPSGDLAGTTRVAKTRLSAAIHAAESDAPAAPMATHRRRACSLSPDMPTRDRTGSRRESTFLGGLSKGSKRQSRLDGMRRRSTLCGNGQAAKDAAAKDAAEGGQDALAQRRCTIIAPPSLDLELIRVRAARVLHPNSTRKFQWDCVITLLVVYSIIVLPVRIGFDLEAPHDSAIFWIECLIDFCFLADLFVNFRTAFYDDTGQLVVSHRRIAGRYLRGWFLIDFVSSIPVDLILFIGSKSSGSNEAYEQFKLAKLLKALRVMRFMKLLRMIKLKGYFKTLKGELDVHPVVTEVLVLFMQTVCFVHLAGCFWHWSAIFNLPDTEPERSDAALGTWLVYFATCPLCEDLEDAGSGPAGRRSLRVLPLVLRSFKFPPTGEAYLTSIYWALTTMSTIGYGDIRAYNNTERVVSILVMLMGSVVLISGMTNVINGMANMVAQLDSQNLRAKRKIDEVKAMMLDVGMPMGLIRRTLRYYETYYNESTDTAMEQRVLAELSPPLRREVLLFIYGRLVTSVDFFAGQDVNFVVSVCKMLKASFASPGDLVFREGEIGSELYLLGKGSASVLCYLDGDELVLDTVEEGTYFGEIALLLETAPGGRRREVSVRASAFCAMYAYHVDALADLLELYPEVKRTMRTRMQARLQKWKLRRAGQLVRRQQRIARALRSFGLGSDDGSQHASRHSSRQSSRNASRKSSKDVTEVSTDLADGTDTSERSGSLKSTRSRLVCSVRRGSSAVQPDVSSRSSSRAPTPRLEDRTRMQEASGRFGEPDKLDEGSLLDHTFDRCQFARVSAASAATPCSARTYLRTACLLRLCP